MVLTAAIAVLVVSEPLVASVGPIEGRPVFVAVGSPVAVYLALCGCAGLGIDPTVSSDFYLTHLSFLKLL